MHILAIPYDMFMFGPFEIAGKLKIHSFGLCVAIGLLVLFILMPRRAEKKLGEYGEDVKSFGLFLVIVGFALAHVFDVLFYHPEKALKNPLLLLEVWGSRSSYGGLIGGIIGIFIWKRMNPQKDFMTYVELGTWGLTFPWLFGRIGCATIHDHPGMKTDFFLGVHFPEGVLRQFPDAAIRHDLGLYEAMWWFVICTTILILDRKPRAKGFFLAVIPIMYAPVRFSLDFLRISDRNYFGLTPAQYCSIILFAFGLYWAKRVWGQEPIVWKEYKPEEEKEEKSEPQKKKPKPKKKKKKQ